MNRILTALAPVNRRTFLKILLPVAIIVAWEVLAIILNNQFILPRIGSVLAVLLHPTADILGNGNLIDNAAISLGRVISGFLVAAAIAIPLGIGMGRSETVHNLFDSLMQMLRPIPPLAWVPLALAWFKIGLVSMIFISAWVHSSLFS
jgi:NitT/TauT family transport system permease protein